MSVNDHVSPREALRYDLRERLRDLTNGAIQRVDVTAMVTDEVGPDEQALPLWQNVPVITVKDFLAAFETTFGEKLPPPNERTAEVAVTSKAAALVVVSAECPRCHISQRIPMSVDVQMIQDRDGESLKLKPTSKETVHACGQLPLPESDDEDEGQTALDDLPPVPSVDEINGVLEQLTDDEADRAGVAEDAAWPDDLAIGHWDDATKREVFAWADALHLSSENTSVIVPPLPFVLGGAGIPDAAESDDFVGDPASIDLATGEAIDKPEITSEDMDAEADLGAGEEDAESDDLLPA